ncbi:hypothetical protein Tco_0688648 [Tanacetum coccineum]
MPPIDDAKLAETMAKYYPDLVCKYYPNHRSYTPPPTLKPLRLQESMVNLADSMAKLEIAVKCLAASTANLVSITSQATFTTNESNTRLETTLQKLICQPTITKNESDDSTSNTNTDIIETTTEVLTQTSSLATNINKHNNTMANLVTDSASSIAKIETETYGRAPLIARMLAIFRCVETFPPGHQCSPPKFVILQSKDEPPWEPHNLKYITMSLEDKARFQARSIDMIHGPSLMHMLRPYPTD